MAKEGPSGEIVYWSLKHSSLVERDPDCRVDLPEFSPKSTTVGRAAPGRYPWAVNLAQGMKRVWAPVSCI